MTELCTVKKLRRGYAYIELTRTEKCKGCDICAFNNKKSVTVPAKCDIEVSVGQTVEVQMPTKSLGATTLLVYAIPLALILIGALIGLVGEWWLQLTLAAVGLLLGLLCAYLIDKAVRRRAGVIPIVTAIANIEGGKAYETEKSTNGE